MYSCMANLAKEAILLDKGQDFSRKNKVHLKIFTTSTETKIADLIWRRNSLAREFNFLPLARQWKYTKRTQHINCLVTFAKQRSYSSLEELSTVQTDAVSVDWSSYDGNMSITWEQNGSLLYLSWKKADFDLRVTVGDKQIRFSQRNRSAHTAFYLICIWTLQGSLVDLSIYIFEFVRCSEKKWEVGETCAASRGIFIFQFSSLFHTCYCNAPAIFKYSVPKQQTTTAAILSGISGNESN